MTIAQQLDRAGRQMWAAVLQQWINDIALGASNAAFDTGRVDKGDCGLDAYRDFSTWSHDNLPEMWHRVCDILDLDAVAVWERVWQRIAASRDTVPRDVEEQLYLEAIAAGFTLAEAYKLAA